MKKWTLMLALVASFGILAAQQIVRKTAVPAPVIEEFEYRFMEAENIVWLKQGEEYYGARFQIKGKGAEAIYTPSGDWIQTAQEIAYLDLPDSARAYCLAHYPDYQAKTVKKVSTRRHGILYEITVSGEMKNIALTFDMHGKLVEKKEKTAKEEDAEIQESATEETEEAPSGMKTKLNKLFKKNEE